METSETPLRNHQANNFLLSIVAPVSLDMAAIMLPISYHRRSYEDGKKIV